MASGKFLKTSLKVVGALVVAVVLLFVVVLNFSAVESRFECAGNVAYEDGQQPLTLHIKLHEYRWWAGLWSDSDGSMWIEVPDQTIEYISHINEVGDQFQLFDNLKGNKEMKGNFSTLSKALAVRIRGIGFYNGTCKDLR